MDVRCDRAPSPLLRGRGGGVASIADEPQQCQFGRVDVCRPAAIGQCDRRSHDHPRLGIVKVTSKKHRGIFVREAGQRVKRRGPNVDVFVLDHPLDGRDPPARDW